MKIFLLSIALLLFAPVEALFAFSNFLSDDAQLAIKKARQSQTIIRKEGSGFITTTYTSQPLGDYFNPGIRLEREDETDFKLLGSITNSDHKTLDPFDSQCVTVYKFVQPEQWCATVAAAGTFGNNTDTEPDTRYLPGDARFGTTNARPQVCSYTAQTTMLELAGVSYMDPFDFTEKIEDASNKNIACHDIPLGPAPPPFCDPLGYPLNDAKVVPMCNEGEAIDTSNLCVDNTSRSRFEQLYARVIIDEPLPVCTGQGGLVDETSGTCALIRNESFLLKPSSVIAECSMANGVYNDNGVTCVRMPASKRGQKTSWPVIHTVKSVLSSGQSVRKVAIAGVLDGSGYADLTMQFNKRDVTPSPASLIDTSSGMPVTRTFKLDAGNSPDYPCVYEDIGNTGIYRMRSCIERPSTPLPQVAMGTVSTHVSPTMKVTLGNPPQTDLVSVSSKTPGPYPTEIYLYGHPFTVEATDSLDTKPDASGNLKGNYDSDGVYIDGLEFENNVYVRGGTQLCLKGGTIEDNALVRLILNTQGQWMASPYPQDVIMSYNPVPGMPLPLISYPNRALPLYAPNSSTPLTSEEQKYTINRGTEALRPKTAKELGLCVLIPAPSDKDTPDTTSLIRLDSCSTVPGMCADSQRQAILTMSQVPLMALNPFSITIEADGITPSMPEHFNIQFDYIDEEDRPDHNNGTAYYTDVEAADGFSLYGFDQWTANYLAGCPDASMCNYLLTMIEREQRFKRDLYLPSIPLKQMCLYSVRLSVDTNNNYNYDMDNKKLINCITF